MKPKQRILGGSQLILSRDKREAGTTGYGEKGQSRWKESRRRAGNIKAGAFKGLGNRLSGKVSIFPAVESSLRQ